MQKPPKCLKSPNLSHSLANKILHSTGLVERAVSPRENILSGATCSHLFINCRVLMGTTLHLLVIVSTEEEENETFCTWPPLVIEKILDVPPHCLTYHRNQRAETWWGSDVTLTFTKTVAKSLTALHETQEQKETVRKYDFLTAFRILSVILNKGCFPKVRKVKVIYICLIFQSVVRLFKWVSTSTSLPPKAFTHLVWNTTDFTSVK